MVQSVPRPLGTQEGVERGRASQGRREPGGKGEASRRKARRHKASRRKARGAIMRDEGGESAHSSGWFSERTASTARVEFSAMQPCWLARMKAFGRLRSHGNM